MTAFNAVRFRVKPGRNQEFLDAHRSVDRNWPGLNRVNMTQTGEHEYCIIGEWDDMDSLAAARPNMLATLGTLPRHAGGLGRRERRHRSGFRAGGAGAEVAVLRSSLLRCARNDEQY
jgi:hypothetical protein